MNISVYVDNLFDRRYRTYGYMNGSSAVAQVNMGRTVGINTRIDFSDYCKGIPKRYPFTPLVKTSNSAESQKY